MKITFMSQQEIEYFSCPDCKKSFVQYKNELIWCNHCNWNLKPKENEELSKFDIYYRNFARKHSEKLFNRLKSKTSLKPKWSIAKVLTLSLIILIIALPLELILFSYLTYNHIPKLAFIVLSVVVFSLIVALRPKKFIPPKNLIDPNQTPELYSLVEQISSRIENTKIHHLAILSDFNAYYVEKGLFNYKKRFVSLGFPLIEILNKEQLIALISHEVSHGANGDIGRSRLFYNALQVLTNLYFILSPQHLDEGAERNNTFYIFQIMGNLVGHFLSYIPLGLYILILKLYMRSNQECESMQIYWLSKLAAPKP